MNLNDAFDAGMEGDIYIIPTDDVQSDENSGAEDDDNIEHIPARILRSTVEVASENEDDDIGCETPVVKRQKRESSRYSETIDEREFTVTAEHSHLEMDNNHEPYDFFKLFFDDDLISFIKMQSMAYSGNIFSTEDLEATFGVLLASGVLHMSRRRDYWSRNKLKHNQAISDSISRDKFESVFSSLHFVPLDAAPQNDKYQKVRLLFSKLNAKFLLHAPECNSFAIDESMVKYFGRHGCKQHIAGKPIRFGFKVWTLATPLGYCLWMEPYPGKAEQATEKYDLGKSGNVVYYLANILKNRYPEQELSLTTDNFFSGLRVFQAVKENLGISCTGTFRKNRLPDNPFDYKEISKSDRGSYVTKRHEDTGLFAGTIIQL